MGKLTVLFVSIYFVIINLFIHQTMAADTFTKSISEFSSTLYQKCVQDKGLENIIISPLSVQTALSLCLMGARGKTAEEMVTGLRLGGSERKDIAENFHQLMSKISGNEMFKIANKIYVMKNFEIKKEFNEIATKQYLSESQSLDFAESQESANEINKWVEHATNDKIKDLIAADSLTSDTRMVLVNAIYFKGLWKYQFQPQFTRDVSFYSSETDSTLVKMMYIKEKFRYGVFDDLDAQAIELPYQNSDVSMFIILPKQRMGIVDLDKKIDTIDFDALYKNMTEVEVEVSLPRFKIEYSSNLNDILSKQMGMELMFSDFADFGDLIESGPPLKVSDVVHKAFIEVNEEGAEAAAATGVMMMTRCMPMMMCPTFMADHSFFYMLWDNKTKNILFAGRHIKAAD